MENKIRTKSRIKYAPPVYLIGRREGRSKYLTELSLSTAGKNDADVTRVPFEKCWTADSKCKIAICSFSVVGENIFHYTNARLCRNLLLDLSTFVFVLDLMRIDSSPILTIALKILFSLVRHLAMSF